MLLDILHQGSKALNKARIWFAEYIQNGTVTEHYAATEMVSTL